MADRDDSIEDQDIPFRRTSSRLQAKTERLVESERQRSRSRSIGREAKVKIPTIEETSEISENVPKSPGRQRTQRERSTTPTRVMPSRAAKSPSRQMSSNTTTPVKLTRSARKRGICTPKEDEEKFVIAESPVKETVETENVLIQTPKKSEGKENVVEEKTEEEEKTPAIKAVEEVSRVPIKENLEKLGEEIVQTPRKTPKKKIVRHSIGAFLRNWKGVDQGEEINQEEEAMDISQAEFVEVESKEGNRVDEEKNEHSPEKIEETSAGSIEIKVPEAEETIEETGIPEEESKVETIQLCVERTLNVVYTNGEEPEKPNNDEIPSPDEKSYEIPLADEKTIDSVSSLPAFSPIREITPKVEEKRPEEVPESLEETNFGGEKAESPKKFSVDEKIIEAQEASPETRSPKKAAVEEDSVGTEKKRLFDVINSIEESPSGKTYSKGVECSNSKKKKKDRKSPENLNKSFAEDLFSEEEVEKEIIQIVESRVETPSEETRSNETEGSPQEMKEKKKRKEKKSSSKESPEKILETQEETKMSCEEGNPEMIKKEKNKKEKKLQKTVEDLKTQERLSEEASPTLSVEDKTIKKDKKKKRKALDEIPEESLSVEPEIVTEMKEETTKKEKKKKKKSPKEKVVQDETPVVEEEEAPVEEPVKKRVPEEPKEKGSSKKMTVAEEESDGALIFPETSIKKMFSDPKKSSKDLKFLLQNLYKWTNSERRGDDLPDEFINDNPETIWQFVSHKNKQINKDWRKYNYLLEEAFGAPEISDSIEKDSIIDEDEEEQEEDGMERMDEEELEDEDGVDLFNLKDEDLKDLEAELDKERSEGPSRDDEKSQKRFRKSVVDDKFFNLDEMNAFCDQAEKQNDELSILDTADDSWGGPAEYRYEDFFGRLDDVVEDDERQEISKKRKATGNINLENKKKKTVRFAMDEGKENEETHFEEKTKQSKILLGQKDEAEKESKLKSDIRKLKASIAQLEEENLKPRSWELSGEVAADQRNENALLETHLQFDNNKKRAPEITEDFTEKLEALIKQRIKDQVFDDVVRMKKVDEKPETYRNDPIEEQEFMKKSLSEVYEKEYQKVAGETEKSTKENPTHKNIEEKMNKLFTMIDALSHFEYTPPTVRPEITVVSNMAALRVEEVGMHASTDAQLLAPEEMKKKMKGELKAEEERTKTDKLRERRKKKIKQRSMVMKVGAEKALSGQIEKKKKKVAGEKKEEKLKSSNFFSKLQDTVQNEIREKTTKKKKIKSEKTTSTGSKFKL